MCFSYTSVAQRYFLGDRHYIDPMTQSTPCDTNWEKLTFIKDSSDNNIASAGNAFRMQQTSHPSEEKSQIDGSSFCENNDTRSKPQYVNSMGDTKDLIAKIYSQSGKSFISAMEVTMLKLYYNLIPTWIADCSVWPVANFINFRYIPLNNRPTFVGIVQVFWQSYLSYTSHKDVTSNLVNDRSVAKVVDDATAISSSANSDPTGAISDDAPTGSMSTGKTSTV